jgi:SAM-dependent methyltransferase
MRHRRLSLDSTGVTATMGHLVFTMPTIRDLPYRAKAVLRHVTPPQAFYLLDAWRGRLNGSEVSVERCFEYLQCMFRSAGFDPRDKEIVEVGSGRFARLGVRLLKAGAARVRAIDLSAVPLSDPRHQAILRRDLEQLSLEPEVLSRLEVVTTDASASDRAKPASADLVFSISVLEHVRDPAALYGQCRDWLVAGGVMIHSVDFRDHDNFAKPFEMLKYPATTWRRFFDPPGGCHLNRWRMGDHVAAARAAGFSEVRAIPLEVAHEELARVRPLRRCRPW